EVVDLWRGGGEVQPVGVFGVGPGGEAAGGHVDGAAQVLPVLDFDPADGVARGLRAPGLDADVGVRAGVAVGRDGGEVVGEAAQAAGGGGRSAVAGGDGDQGGGDSDRERD